MNSKKFLELLSDMICQNKIQEYNIERDCWLPKDPESPFDLCKRCTYYRIEEVLSKGQIEFLSIPAFQTASCKKEHIDSLLSVFARKELDTRNLFLEYLKNQDFYQAIKNQAPKHRASNRCFLYQQYYKLRKMDIVGTAPLDLPIYCWPCIAWILRQKYMLRFSDAFLIRASAQQLRMPPETKYIVDAMISLEINEKPNTVRTVLNSYRLAVTNDILETTIADFFSEPPTASHVFTGTAEHYIPYPNRSMILETLKKRVLANIRKRNWVFKEELMMRTWAPERMVEWCFDLEERQEYAILDND